jgi:hypothetical protein
MSSATNRAGRLQAPAISMNLSLFHGFAIVRTSALGPGRVWRYDAWAGETGTIVGAQLGIGGIC